MPDTDDEVEAGEDFGAVESVKAASDLTSPVSGTVVEVNEALEDTPEIINQDAFLSQVPSLRFQEQTVPRTYMPALLAFHLLLPRLPLLL